MSFPRDERLLDFATDKQKEYLKAYWAEGSYRAAARKLEVNKKTVSEAIRMVMARAAKQGYSPEHDMTHTVPDGFKLKGTSTLYDGDGQMVQQWVKSQEDRERQIEIMREVVEGLAASLPKLSLIKPPKVVSDETMTGYPVGDHHLGMYAWAPEAGEDYDLNIAEHLLVSAMAYLTNAVPKSKRALIAFLGDFMHYDSEVPLTPTNKNYLDADGRFGKLAEVALRVSCAMIMLALKKHEEVDVIVLKGNHDPTGMLMLAHALARIFADNPRVRIDTSPAEFHYFEYGANLIGLNHGHRIKLPNLPQIMAHDRPEAWGRTRHRYWWTGHVHHQKVFEFPGCTAESFRVLAVNDAHATGGGYRSKREMTAIVLDKNHGELGRHTVRPEMLNA